MKEIKNERGDIIQFLLIILALLGLTIFFTIKLFLTGQWIIGSLLVIFLIIPAFLVAIKRIFGVDIEKNIDERLKALEEEKNNLKR